MEHVYRLTVTDDNCSPHEEQHLGLYRAVAIAEHTIVSDYKERYEDLSKEEAFSILATRHSFKNPSRISYKHQHNDVQYTVYEEAVL